MKKKLALILAATMTMTLLPMNLFAATQNSLTNVAYVVKSGTVFFEDGMIAAPGSIAGSNHKDVNYAINGGSLVLYPQQGSNFVKGQTFKLKLTNGEWFFKNAVEPTGDTVANSTAVANAIATAKTIPGTNVGPTGTTVTNGSGHGDFFGSTINGSGPKLPALGANWGTATSAGAMALSGRATYDTRKGIFVTSGSGITTAQTAAEGVYVRTPFRGGVNPSGTQYSEEIGYEMLISATDPTTAVITIDDTNAAVGMLNQTPSLVVPLAVYGNSGSKDVTVSIQPGTATAPTPQVLTYAVGGSAGTTAVQSTVPSTLPITGRKEFVLNPIMIQENRIASLGQIGTFEIKAPDGFHFKNSSGVNVSAEPGYSLTGATVDVGFNKGSLPINGGTGSVIDQSTLVVAIAGATKSTTIQGSLDITGLVVVANDDTSAFKDIALTITNRANVSNLTLVDEANSPVATNATIFNDDLGVTNQTLTVATRTDWTLDFKAQGTIPTLYNGRYLDPGASGYDANMQAATIYFGEVSPSSWWAQRETVFTLPDGVRFNKVYMHDTDNLEYPGSGTQSTDFDGGVYTPRLQNANTTDYFISNDNTGTVNVTNNKVTIDAVNVDTTDKTNTADFMMDTWLSIAPTFTGPVQLRCDGSAISSPLDPVTIANVVNPVTVSVAKVSDVKIGYQYQPVSNITITENGIGALLKGKVMKVSVSDLISTDLSLAPGATVAVTSGDLKLNNITSSISGMATDNSIAAGTSGGNAISFTIDRASSVSPSTIVISNVAVKVDRSVPQSNNTPYKVVIWGTAIAENFNTKVDTAANGGAYADQFDQRGIFTDYISVVSAPNDVASVLTQEVRMPIGQSTYTINGVSNDMAATSYISTKSNSAMVPVRFVAQAFGLTADQVIWDQKAKTVTLMTPSGKVIQFKADSTDMIINNVTIPMLSLDTPPMPVAAEYDAAAGRVYIPFRALGNAFGVPVSFDTATNTAIYNAGANNATTATTVQ